MDLIKCFSQYDFDKFNNIYTIRRHPIEMWSKGYNPEDFFINKFVDCDMLKIYKSLKPDATLKYLLLGVKRKYYPIFGHFYNNVNHFIYKKIYNRKIQDLFEPVKYHIINYEQLANPGIHNYYRCRDIDDLYDTIDKLQKHELPDIFNIDTLIKDVDEWSELYSFNNLYTYENETITEFLSDDQIKFTYDSESHLLHIE